MDEMKFQPTKTYGSEEAVRKAVKIYPGKRYTIVALKVADHFRYAPVFFGGASVRAAAVLSHNGFTVVG